MGQTLLINPTAMEAGLLASAEARGRSPAFDAFAKTGLPHRRLEAWKWTDVRGAMRAALPEAASGAEVIAPSSFSAVDAFEITVMNGAAEWSGAPPQGVAVELAKSGEALSPLAADHPLGSLAAAFANNTLNISITGGVARPIHLRRIAGAGASYSRVRIKLADGASATLIESFDGAGAYFANSLTEAAIGANAKLTRDILQDGSDEGVETALFAASLGAGAAFHQTALLLGGKLIRMETRLALEGAGASADFKSASILSGARHADLTTHIAHQSTGCATRQIHKSALRDRARGVFQGKFLVARGAQKTDAEMQAKALLLSDTAEANHKPELEIYADDVQCAHGSTAGAIDEEALFYMRQRGLDEHQARALLIEAFLADVFDGAERINIAEVMRQRMHAWLEKAA
ncbi:MAG: Fe-S cluster assembly protein SufD [Amphiplicatus sp.]